MENETEDAIVEWFCKTTDPETRHQVLKRIFNALPNEDFTKCFSLISKVKKNRKKVEAEQQPGQPPQNNPIPECAGASGSARPPSVPLALAKTGWLVEFKKDEVVGIDVEKVQVTSSNPKKKYDQKAGIISVKDAEQRQIFYAKIWRAKGSYHVNSTTKRLNGITETTLQEDDCELPEVAYARLRKVLTGKLVVGVALEPDFNSFDDIPFGMYKTFDLQWYYYRLSFSKYHKRIEDGIGLCDLVSHFFKVDMQPEGKQHDAEVDAEWTVRLFLEVYCEMKPSPASKGNSYGYDGVPRLAKNK